MRGVKMTKDTSLDESPVGNDSSDESPEWYSEENPKLNARAVLKFFTPDGSLSWVASDFDGEDILFGRVVGVEIELWSISDGELQYLHCSTGTPIERKTYFEFRSLRDLMDMFDRES